MYGRGGGARARFYSLNFFIPKSVEEFVKLMNKFRLCMPTMQMAPKNKENNKKKKQQQQLEEEGGEDYRKRRDRNNQVKKPTDRIDLSRITVRH